MSPTVFDSGTDADAQKLGIQLKPGDKLYIGNFAVPKNGALKYPAMILHTAAGQDILFIDGQRNGRYERYRFEPLAQPEDRIKSGVTAEVALPSGPFRSFPMLVRMAADGVKWPLKPGQIVVPYTAFAVADGSVKLPARTLRMQFEYRFDGTVDLAHGIEIADVNGDGILDRHPGGGEFLRSDGVPPLFPVGDLTVQTTAVNLENHTFTVRSVPNSERVRLNLAPGATIPDFTFTDFAGKERRFSEIKGRYRLLDFWATDCAPCVADLPLEAKAYAAFHDRGFEIVGMNGDRSPEREAKAQQMVAKLGISWPQARFDSQLFEGKFGVTQWPMLLLVDEQGRIVSNGSGALPLRGAELQGTLTKLYAGR